MRRVMFVVVLLCLCLPVIAQEGDDSAAINRLPEFLSYVPDTDEARAWFTFADYDAMTAARTGAVKPTTAALLESELPPFELWWRSFLGISSGVRFDFFFQWVDEGDTTNGFTFFDLRASIEYGMPPAAGQIIIADYNPERVVAVHSEREYTSVDGGGYTLLCGAAGCDAGNDLDIANRNVGYIFGGNFGRQQAVVLVEEAGVVMSSPAQNVVERFIDGVVIDAPSLADDADYLAIAESAAHEADFVVQGYILVADDVLGTEANVSLPAFASFAPFEIFGIIESIDSETDEQVARFMLVYDNEGDAQAAADAIVDRLAVAESLLADRPFMVLFEQRNMVLTTYALHHEATDRWLAMIEFRAPHAISLDSSTSEIPGNSSMAVKLLVDMMIARDLYWLMPDLAAGE